MCPSQTHCIYIVINKLKPATQLIIKKVNVFFKYMIFYNCKLRYALANAWGVDMLTFIELRYALVNAWGVDH